MATPDLLLKNEFADRSELRFDSNTLPRNEFVPEGVTIRTEVAPPAESAPDTDVVMLISETLSDVGRFGRKSREFVRMKLSWTLMPSTVTWVQVGRPPSMAVLLRCVIPGTPACSLMRFVTSRPGIGSASTSRCCTVVLTSGVVVFTSETPATTSTVSLNCPSSSLADSEYSAPVLTMTWL